MLARTLALGATSVALAMLAVPAAEARAAVTGSLTVTVTARGERALDARGVKLSTTGKATRKGRQVVLPISAGGPAALRTAGSLRLRAKHRSITLGSPRLELGANPRITALVAGHRSTVLTLNVAPDSSSAGVKLQATGTTLTAAAARAIARKLRIAALPRTQFATVAATGTFAAAAPPVVVNGTPVAGGCGASTAGGTPPVAAPGVPPVKSQPAGALPLATATVVWHVRDSFIQYMASGEGTTASAGATSEPATVEPPSDASLVYGFRFTPTGGWCDPVTGAARLTFSGTVGFSYRAHEIDLRANDPEIELDGPASRVIFRMTGSGSTDGGNQRSVIETLDVSKAAAVRVDGKTVTYERIPAAIPPGAADSVFAGYYFPGDPFGWVSITFTTV